jgi:K+/H+ antiporter YhaU regulatory subunit KhtT
MGRPAKQRAVSKHKGRDKTAAWRKRQREKNPDFDRMAAMKQAEYRQRTKLEAEDDEERVAMAEMLCYTLAQHSQKDVQPATRPRASRSAKTQKAEEELPNVPALQPMLDTTVQDVHKVLGHTKLVTSTGVCNDTSLCGMC